jgi:hypothetical protein
MIFIEKTSISYQNSGERISGEYSDLMAIIYSSIEIVLVPIFLKMGLIQP